MSAEAKDRSLARRVAGLLFEKGRPAEAVAVLAAWASSGANDSEGQELLADALRNDPANALAKMAFERMEGIAGDHGPLLAAIAQYGEAELLQIERQYRKPVFQRAQLGFNNNVKYKASVYHVQTEDSGIERPHIITHLFADGGRVIKSHKRVYASELKRTDVAAYVRSLMKAQHMEMCIALRDGKFDDIISGAASGGMTLFEGLPEITVRRGAGEAKAATEEAALKAAPLAASSTGQARVSFLTLRCLWGGPERYDPVGDEIVLGRHGDVALTGERFCNTEEATIRYRGGKLWLIDRDGGNGVYMRIRTPVELLFEDQFLVGDQVVSLKRTPPSDDQPGPGPTYFYASPRWHSSFRLVQLWEGGGFGAVCVARGSVAQVGRSMGDMLFRHDPLISDQHCVVEEQAGALVLSDLGSRSGTFVRVTGEREITDGDELAIGRTRLRVSVP